MSRVINPTNLNLCDGKMQMKFIATVMFCLSGKNLAAIFHRLTAFFLLSMLSVSAVIAGDLTELEAKGKQLYYHGTFHIVNEPNALIGSESTPVLASIVPCVGCHGEDGAGRPEGAVVPPAVTWRYLIKPYGHKHPNARIHPAFTEKSLAMAIQKGIDPAGNHLDSAMPRYEFSKVQLSALIAYLKRIETEHAPGVNEDSIRIGTVLPLKGPLADFGEEMKAILTAYFNEVNGQGGIYNRKIQLQVVDSSESSAITLARVTELIESEQIFAILDASMTGVDNELSTLAEREMVPLLGSLNLYPEGALAPTRYSFYLFSGITVQMRTLIDYAAVNLRLINPLMAIIYPENGSLRETLAAMDQQGEIYNLASSFRIAYPPTRFNSTATVRELKVRGTNLLYFLGGGAELKELLAAVHPTDWRPYILLPGSSIQGDIFAESNNLLSKILLAFPTVPTDWSPEGIAAFNRLRGNAGISTRHMVTEVITYCSAQLLVHGLKLVGRQLSRGKFISVLEGINEFETGLTQKLSFGANRHIGALGAYVVSIDPKNKQFKVSSDWLVPREFRPPIN
jgi:ABC-type branched-subunit amino acid transport system substrate-binding protein